MHEYLHFFPDTILHFKLKQNKKLFNTQGWSKGWFWFFSQSFERVIY